MTVNLPADIGPLNLYVVFLCYRPDPSRPELIYSHTCFVYDVSPDEATRRAVHYSLIDPAGLIKTSAVSLEHMLRMLHHLRYDCAQHSAGQLTVAGLA